MPLYLVQQDDLHSVPHPPPSSVHSRSLNHLNESPISSHSTQDRSETLYSHVPEARKSATLAICRIRQWPGPHAFAPSRQNKSDDLPLHTPRKGKWEGRGIIVISQRLRAVPNRLRRSHAPTNLMAALERKFHAPSGTPYLPAGFNCPIFPAVPLSRAALNMGSVIPVYSPTNTVYTHVSMPHVAP